MGGAVFNVRMSQVEILIASRFEADEILDCADGAEVQFLVSIGDPEAPEPRGYTRIERRLRLIFRDTIDETGATERDIERLIEFARSIKGAIGTVLAHCEAGISRSTAAAYIVYAVVLGTGTEREALLRVCSQRPSAKPNRRMVEIADRLLGRGGTLVDALQEIDY